MINSLQLWMTQMRAGVLPRDGLGARFARGAIWSTIRTIVSRAGSLVTSVFVARLLGKVSFGELGMINNTVGMFGLFAGLGLGLTATKYVAEYRTKDPGRAGRILGLSLQVAFASGIVVSVLVFALAPLLATQTLNAPHLVNELRLGCLLLFLNAINGAQTGVLSGLESFKTIAQINLWLGLLNVLVMISSAWFFGLPGVVAAMTVVSGAGLLLNYLFVRRECARAGITITYHGVDAELSVLWKFSLPAFLSGLVAVPATWLANTILVHQPGGYGELGLLNAANQWRTVIMFFPTALSSVALPMLSAQQGVADGKRNHDKLIDITQSLCIIAVVPVSTLIIFAGGWIIGLYGRDFSGGQLVFATVVAGATIAAIGSIGGPLIQAKGKMWLGAFMNLVWGIVYISFVAAFAAQWGGMSLAIGILLAHLVLLTLAYLYFHFSGDIPSGMLTRTFSAAAFIAGMSFLSQWVTAYVRLWLAMPVVLLSLGLSLWLWSTPELRRRIFSPIKMYRLIGR